MRIGVTGAHGFVGSKLIEALLARGHEVRGFTRTPVRAMHPMLTYESYVLGEAPSFDGLDALVHTAFEPRDRSVGGINVRGAKVLTDALRAAAGKQDSRTHRLIFLSSLAAFPGCASQYGMGKLLAEEMVAEVGGISIRPGTIYSQSSGGLLGTLERMIRSLPIIPAIGGLKLHLIHLDDLIELVVSTAEGNFGEPGGVYALAYPEATSLRELIDRILKSQGRNAPSIPVPASLALRGLKLLEALRLPAGPGSDALLSLMNSNPDPRLVPLSELRKLGVHVGGAEERSKTLLFGGR